MTEVQLTTSIDSVLQDELGIFPVWMSPEAKLLTIFLAFVNPAIYDGGSSLDCMVCQTRRLLGYKDRWNAVVAVSAWSGVDAKMVAAIYDEMCRTRYSRDYRASIERAAEILRVDLPGVLALFDGCDNYTLSKPAGD